MTTRTSQSGRKKGCFCKLNLDELVVPKLTHRRYRISKKK